jgi:hypothetical protein
MLQREFLKQSKSLGKAAGSAKIAVVFDGAHIEPCFGLKSLIDLLVSLWRLPCPLSFRSTMKLSV